VPTRALYIVHDRQIARHGGAPGLRDAALLEAGADRPRNLAAYGRPDACELAASYAFGIAKAHAFVDGNKRTAFVASATFLRLNGYAFRPDPLNGVRMMEGLAASEVTEAEFAAWLRESAIALI
jgi:death-on-curing protein